MLKTPNISDADGFYEALLNAHAGLSIDQSHALNERLLMIFANQIGDLETLTACIAAALRTGKDKAA